MNIIVQRVSNRNVTFPFLFMIKEIINNIVVPFDIQFDSGVESSRNNETVSTETFALSAGMLLICGEKLNYRD